MRTTYRGHLLDTWFTAERFSQLHCGLFVQGDDSNTQKQSLVVPDVRSGLSESTSTDRSLCFVSSIDSIAFDRMWISSGQPRFDPRNLGAMTICDRFDRPVLLASPIVADRGIPRVSEGHGHLGPSRMSRKTLGPVDTKRMSPTGGLRPRLVFD